MNLSPRLVMVILCVWVPFSCAKKTDEESSSPESAPISAPSALSVTVDMSTTSDDAALNLDGDGSIANLTTTGLNVNALTAGTIATIWNSVVSAVLALPAAALAKAASVTPTHDKDSDSWTWSYQSSALSKTYDVALVGTPVSGGPGATWVMTVDSSGGTDTSCCKGFKWIEGSTDGEGSGTWSIRNPKDPSAAATTLDIGWDVKSETDRTLILKDTDASTDGDDYGFGSTLTYAVSGDDLSMTILNKAKSETVVIAIDKSDNSGSLTKADGSKLCWDENKKDVDCP